MANRHWENFGIIAAYLQTHLQNLTGGKSAEPPEKFLNEIEPFKNEYPPSSENIAYYIATQLQPEVEKQDVLVSRVTAWESDNACATYAPD